MNRFGIIETPYVKVAKGILTGEVVYLNAHEEEGFTIAHAAVEVDDKGKIKCLTTSPGMRIIQLFGNFAALPPTKDH